MQLGYSLWQESHFQPDNLKFLLGELKSLSINWVSVVIPFAISTNESSDLHETQLNRVDIHNALQLLKLQNFNILLKVHVYSDYAGGAEPAWWPGYIFTRDHTGFITKLWDQFKPFLQYQPNNVCVGAEIDAQTIYVDDWIWFANQVRKNFGGGVIYGANGFQPLRETYSSQISFYLWLQGLFSWWTKKDPYKQLIDLLVSTGALGGQTIPDSMKGDLGRRLLNGRPKLLNRYLDGTGMQFYYTPPMLRDILIAKEPEAVYHQYTSYNAPILGKVNYVNSVKQFAQGQDLWLTETTLLHYFGDYNPELYKVWAEGTIRAARETGALILFLWSDRTKPENDEWLNSLKAVNVR